MTGAEVETMSDDADPRDCSQDELCQIGFDRWGIDMQATIAMEELAELTVAISHWLRGRDGSLDELVEEVADVILVCRSLRLLAGADEVDAMVDAKWARLRERLAK